MKPRSEEVVYHFAVVGVLMDARFKFLTEVLVFDPNPKIKQKRQPIKLRAGCNHVLCLLLPAVRCMTSSLERRAHFAILPCTVPLTPLPSI
jgi:hypothetical protein